MPSIAWIEWRTARLPWLAELEDVHAKLTGTGRGRRWGTTQLNRSLFIVLVAQFQSYCRELHDEAILVHVDAAVATQRPMLEELLFQGRKLDTNNPRRSTLGSDFDRLGFAFIPALKARGPLTVQRLEALEVLVDYRNAVGHGDESKVAAVEAEEAIRATKQSYQRYRQALDKLAGTMDDVVADSLTQILGVARPG